MNNNGKARTGGGTGGGTSGPSSKAMHKPLSDMPPARDLPSGGGGTSAQTNASRSEMKRINALNIEPASRKSQPQNLGSQQGQQGGQQQGQNQQNQQQVDLSAQSRRIINSGAADADAARNKSLTNKTLNPQAKEFSLSALPFTPSSAAAANQQPAMKPAAETMPQNPPPVFKLNSQSGLTKSSLEDILNSCFDRVRNERPDIEEPWMCTKGTSYLQVLGLPSSVATMPNQRMMPPQQPWQQPPPNGGGQMNQGGVHGGNMQGGPQSMGNNMQPFMMPGNQMQGGYMVANMAGAQQPGMYPQMFVMPQGMQPFMQNGGQQQGIQQNMQQNMQPGMQQGMNPNMQQGGQQGMNPNMQQGMNPNMHQQNMQNMQNMGQMGGQQGMNQGMNMRMDNGMQQGMNQGMNQGMMNQGQQAAFISGNFPGGQMPQFCFSVS